MSFDDEGFLSPDIANFVNRFDSHNKDLLDLALELNRFALRTMLSLQAHNRVLQEMVVASLFIRCMNHYQTTVMLCRHGLIPEAKIVARSLMEAMFILVAASKNAHHAEQYAQEDEHQRIKALRRYMGIHQEPPPGKSKEEMAEWEAEIRRNIAGKEIKKKSTEAWARDADLEYWYLSPYFHLSESVHAKSRDVADHVVTNEDNEAVEFTWGPSEAGARIVLGTVIECLCQVVGYASNVFGREVKETLDQFGTRLRGLSLDDIEQKA